MDHISSLLWGRQNSVSLFKLFISSNKNFYKFHTILFPAEQDHSLKTAKDPVSAITETGSYCKIIWGQEEKYAGKKWKMLSRSIGTKQFIFFHSKAVSFTLSLYNFDTT